MVSPRTKGRLTEKRCEKKLQELGYITYLVPPSRPFQQVQDIFHLWDLIAMRGDEVLFVQVKTNYHSGYVKYRKFQENFPGVRCQLWNWQTHNGWIVKDFHSQVVDQRS